MKTFPSEATLSFQNGMVEPCSIMAFLVLPLLLTFSPLAWADEPAPPEDLADVPPGPETSAGARLLHDPVAAAIELASRPLSEPAPKPLPPAEILDTVEYVLPDEGRSIIIQKTAPPPGYTAPPVPEPATNRAASAPAAIPRLARNAADRPEIRYLHFSATVHLVADASPATLVRWSHEGKTYQAWSSIDWNHFRSLNRFDSADGKKIYTMLLGVGNAGRWKARPDAPVPPVFAPGEISWRLLVGDATDKAAFADLETLHDLYRTDGTKLRLAFEIREEAIRARQEWLKANPPEPRDIVLRHWKVPTPSVPPTPENQEVVP